MGDIDILSQHLTPSFSNIQADTTAQKRALSYASTIITLFNQVMQNKQAADRVVGEYFRLNKKHGSKDRRVIRESLFALFRWWGWLNKFNRQDTELDAQAWFTILSCNARLESHVWGDIIDAWASNAAPESALSSNEEQATIELVSVTDKCRWLNAKFAHLSFSFAELVPEWFWQTCPMDDDQQKLALIESLSSRPPIWGRAQTLTAPQVVKALIAQDIAAKTSEYFSDAVNLGHKSINLNGLNLYKEGKLEIQDLASQVIGQICAPLEGDLWWDTCSGAGGKTLQLRSLMLQQNPKAKGCIVSSDIRRKPLEELIKRAKRASFNGISTSPWLSDELPVPQAHFDGVLVDAPCSCTGTWRRNPDMRWIDNIYTVEDKPSLQLDILSRSSYAVKAGGVLVYATCSLSPLENEDVVQAFLAAHNEFSLLSLTHPFTGKAADMLTIYPFEANSDGMFVAKMIRR